MITSLSDLFLLHFLLGLHKLLDFIYLKFDLNKL